MEAHLRLEKGVNQENIRNDELKIMRCFVMAFVQMPSWTSK